MTTLITLVTIWLAFILMYRSEPRRLANAAILLPAVLMTLSSISELVTSLVPGVGYVLALLVICLPLMLLVFSFVLIHNGVQMWRREGHGIANMLSLICGVLVLLLPVLALLLVRTQHWLGLLLAFFLLMGTVFTAMSFTMVLLYAWLYARWPVRGTPDAVVVLGARTVEGKPTPLLRGRLDKGIELFRAGPGTERMNELWIIPTGGQGPDELEPEGVSMGRYLARQGIDSGRILVEDRARDTEQNLRFSNALLSRHGQGRRMWLVTSDYHALRAALISRRLGLEAAAFGSRTARYYRPSAFLREFIAILRDHWLTFAVLAIPFAVLLGIGIIFSLNR